MGEKKKGQDINGKRGIVANLEKWGRVRPWGVPNTGRQGGETGKRAKKGVGAQRAGVG